MLVAINPIPGEYYNIGGTYSCSVGDMLDYLLSCTAYKDISIGIDPERIRRVDADLKNSGYIKVPESYRL